MPFRVSSPADYIVELLQKRGLVSKNAAGETRNWAAGLTLGDGGSAEVIDHILKHGSVTTEQLSELYGYDHAPRAARDVRELGIPLETFRVEGKSGRRIAAYRFGDPSEVRGGKLGGRKARAKRVQI